MSSILRTKHDDIYLKKKTVMEYFEKPVKSVGRGLFIKKIEIFVRKSLVKIVTFFNIFFVANRKNVRQHIRLIWFTLWEDK